VIVRSHGTRTSRKEIAHVEKKMKSASGRIVPTRSGRIVPNRR
jgi:hypothetical protein